MFFLKYISKTVYLAYYVTDQRTKAPKIVIVLHIYTFQKQCIWLTSSPTKEKKTPKIVIVLHIYRIKTKIIEIDMLKDHFFVEIKII